MVFSIYLMPHEVVHVFYDHHDTEHHEAEHGKETTLSSIHMHCDFLYSELTDFLPVEETQPSGYSLVIPFHYEMVDVQTVRCISILRDSRGPPMS